MKASENKKGNVYVYAGAGIIICLAAVMALLLCMYLYHYNTGVQIIRVASENITTAENYRWELEQIEEDARAYYYQGYCLKAGEDMGKAGTKLLLLDEQTGEYIAVPTEYEKREDVTDMIADGCSYDNAGFRALVAKKYLDSEHTYSLYILYHDGEDDVYIPTGQSLIED